MDKTKFEVKTLIFKVCKFDVFKPFKLLKIIFVGNSPSFLMPILEKRKKRNFKRFEPFVSYGFENLAR